MLARGRLRQRARCRAAPIRQPASAGGAEHGHHLVAALRQPGACSRSTPCGASAQAALRPRGRADEHVGRRLRHQPLQPRRRRTAGTRWSPNSPTCSPARWIGQRRATAPSIRPSGRWSRSGASARTPMPSITVPSPAALAAARARVGWQRLDFDRASHTHRAAGRHLARPVGHRQGLCGRPCGRWRCRRSGSANFLVEVGGELRGVGRRPGGAALAGADRRRARRRRHTSRSATWPIATSGRPLARARAGRPALVAHHRSALAASRRRTRWRSVTVLHRECMHADALATVLTVLGPDDGLAFAAAPCAGRAVRRAATAKARDAWPATPGRASSAA